MVSVLDTWARNLLNKFWKGEEEYYDKHIYLQDQLQADYSLDFVLYFNFILSLFMCSCSTQRTTFACKLLSVRIYSSSWLSVGPSVCPYNAFLSYMKYFWPTLNWQVFAIFTAVKFSIVETLWEGRLIGVNFHRHSHSQSRQSYSYSGDDSIALNTVGGDSYYDQDSKNPPQMAEIPETVVTFTENPDDLRYYSENIFYRLQWIQCLSYIILLGAVAFFIDFKIMARKMYIENAVENYQVKKFKYGFLKFLNGRKCIVFLLNRQSRELYLNFFAKSRIFLFQTIFDAHFIKIVNAWH